MRLNKSIKEDKLASAAAKTATTTAAATTKTSSSSSTTEASKQRFRGSSAAVPLAGPSSNTTTPSLGPVSTSQHSPSSGRRVFKPQSAPTTGSQRVVALLQDAKRYWKHHRHRRGSDHGLPHHHHHHHSSTGKSKGDGKAWHVDIPKRMIFSTMAVFLLLPLTLFYWKETHLPDQEAVQVESKMTMTHTGTTNRNGHDVFPNWFADQQSSMDNNNNNNEGNETPDTTLLPAESDTAAVAAAAAAESAAQSSQDDPQAAAAASQQQQQPVPAWEAGPVADALSHNSTSGGKEQVDDDDASQLNKFQFVNDTAIPDNDPLSDPETADKIGGKKAAAAASDKSVQEETIEERAAVGGGA